MIEENASYAIIEKEIEILKHMDHPNIIKVYQVIENQSHVYIVMEYSGGGELYSYLIQRKRLDENEASSFFMQIISAIEYMHEQKTVHRHKLNKGI